MLNDVTHALGYRARVTMRVKRLPMSLLPHSWMGPLRGLRHSEARPEAFCFGKSPSELLDGAPAVQWLRATERRATSALGKLAGLASRQSHASSQATAPI